MQHLDNVMVVGGEDKPRRQLMPQAVQELLDKHKGSNPALYGDLGYLILFATAGDAVRVFALQLHPNASLQPLMPEFVVRHKTISRRASSTSTTMFCLTKSDLKSFASLSYKSAAHISCNAQHDFHWQCRWWTYWVGSASSNCSST